MLRPEDAAFLDKTHPGYDVIVQDRVTLAILHEYRLPPGLSPEVVDLLVQLPPGFPDVPPDMFWTFPTVTDRQGAVPAAANATGDFVGRTWQRWSRHLVNSEWRPGDDLRTYLGYVRRCLAVAAGAAA